jgi:hypothetical protein
MGGINAVLIFPKRRSRSPHNGGRGDQSVSVIGNSILGFRWSSSAVWRRRQGNGSVLAYMLGNEGCMGAEPVAGSSNLDHDSMLQEAIQLGRRDDGVAERLICIGANSDHDSTDDDLHSGRNHGFHRDHFLGTGDASSAISSASIARAARLSGTTSCLVCSSLQPWTCQNVGPCRPARHPSPMPRVPGSPPEPSRLLDHRKSRNPAVLWAVQMNAQLAASFQAKPPTSMRAENDAFRSPTAGRGGGDVALTDARGRVRCGKLAG